MTREEAAEELKRICRLDIIPGDNDPYKTSDALYMAIHELEKEEPVYPDLKLIDKEKFVEKLVNARDVINIICSADHSDDGFEHPIVKIINGMISMIQHQEAVRL